MKWPLLIFLIVVIGGFVNAQMTRLEEQRFGWDRTTTTFYTQGVGYEPTESGLMLVKRGEYIQSAFSEAIAGTADGVFYFTDSTSFHWRWTLTNLSNTYRLRGYNGVSSFAWVKDFFFTEGEPIKTTVSFYNGLVDIRNFHVYYLHSIDAGNWISYNDFDYEAGYEETILLVNDSLNDIVPKFYLGEDYSFNFSDIAQDPRFIIDTFFLGNASVLGYSEDILFTALGVRPNSSIFSVGDTIVLDPMISNAFNINAEMQAQTERLIRDSKGMFHTVYTHSTTYNLIHRNSTDGITWSDEHVAMNATCVICNTLSPKKPNILVDYNDNLWLSAETASPQKNSLVNSSDGGLTWKNVTYFSQAGSERWSTGGVTSDNTVHLCLYTRLRLPGKARIFYVNSTDWDNVIGVNTDIADDAGFCDLEVGNDDDIYIVGFSEDTDMAYIWDSEIGLNITHRKTIGTMNTMIPQMDGSIAIDDNDNIFVGFSDDCLFCSGKPRPLLYYKLNSSSVDTFWEFQQFIGFNSAAYNLDVGTNNKGVFVTWNNDTGTKANGVFSKFWTFEGKVLGELNTIDPLGVHAFIQDSNTPKGINRMNDTAFFNYIHWNSGLGGFFEWWIGNVSVGDSLCNYSTTFERDDWEIKQSCQRGEDFSTCPYGMNITGLGQLNITNNAVLETKEIIWKPSGDLPYRLKWETGSGLKWGSSSC